MCQIPRELERFRAEEDRLCQERDRLTTELEMHVSPLAKRRLLFLLQRILFK